MKISFLIINKDIVLKKFIYQSVINLIIDVIPILLSNGIVLSLKIETVFSSGKTKTSSNFVKTPSKAEAVLIKVALNSLKLYFDFVSRDKRASASKI